ncbi:MAG TPA: hypothetical protein VND23_06565 [Acidimicrobiales bacterium]|nr:hypothetical protein [Acidimicrobiales bacterium]
METLRGPGPAHVPAADPAATVSRRPGLGRRWTTDRAGLVGSATTVAVVVGVTAFVLVQLQPGLLFGPNMDVGGDTAGHVAAVHFFVHDLLPNFEISGWDPQWFGGFPLYVFYFPLPAVVVAILSAVFPYAVAFKLVTALGPLLMPVAAYTFGRLAGFRRPVPALMSAAMLPVLFNFASGANSSVYVSWNIDGGTIASTMAGEFSFTLALSMSLLFLGVFAFALRTGRLRWLAAVLFVATLLCHVVPALFAAGAAVVITLVVGRPRSIRSVLIPVGAVGGLLAAFWLLPFAAYLHYSTSMGYGRVGNDYQNLVPQNGEQAVQWLALAGLVLAIGRRERIVIAIGLIAVCSALGFLFLPSGLVYNGRWLPFWFATTALVAAYAVAESARVAWAVVVSRSDAWQPPVTATLGGLAVVALVAGWLGVLPLHSTPAGEKNPVDGWTAWNYSGYQAKPGWHEFSTLVSMTERVARRYGCGRLDYEYSPNMTDAYGSTIVPMSFPLWTNGCIDTTEGLYYESSTTTPFHFLDQSELSIAPSNPVVGIPYQGLNVADGIRHLQLTGVRYFLANSPAVEQAAAADPALQRVGSSPASALVVDGLASTAAAPPGSAWVLYLVHDSALVTPLSYDPVVEAGLSKQSFLSLGISWYQDESYWPVPVARAGPSSWPRATAGTLVPPGRAVRTRTVTVSAVHSTTSSVSFDVSATGHPVLVKVPYFPNWKAIGAAGPFEVTPNLMVVVPNARHVTLVYGTTGIDWLGKVGSIAGIVGAGAIARPTARAGLRAPRSGDAEPAGRPPGGESAARAAQWFDGDGDGDGDGRVAPRRGRGRGPAPRRTRRSILPGDSGEHADVGPDAAHPGYAGDGAGAGAGQPT